MAEEIATTMRAAYRAAYSIAVGGTRPQQVAEAEQAHGGGVHPLPACIPAGPHGCVCEVGAVATFAPITAIIRSKVHLYAQFYKNYSARPQDM
eukprot:scaffold147797_cov24-Tisochrysis_lutea.AAC.1